MLKILFYILFYVLCGIDAKENSKLLFAQILFRHGDRAPINLYPTDPNPENFWAEGLGKLTILGRKQHYALGKFLRKMYENFTTSSPNEVSVISSGSDRCLKSAETNLASFFEPSPEWQFDMHLNWQPISVLYIPKAEDKYLETESNCPRAFAEQYKVVYSPEGRAFIAKHKEMFENLTVNSGSPIIDWISASHLHDTLFIEKKYNLTIPYWAEPYWNELEQVADMSFYWSFNSPLLHRLRAGPLLKKMIEMMKSKLEGDIPLQKVQIYSGHDTNIAVMLDALNLFNGKQPPYCASLFLELHELFNGVKAVKLLYQNSTKPEKGIQPPYILTLHGCSKFCPLDDFIKLTKKLIPDDWEKECQVNVPLTENEYKKGIIVGICSSVISFMVIMSIYAVWKVLSKSQDKYSYKLIPLN